MKTVNSGTCEYKKLTVEEQKKRGILGRLVGTIADFKNPTRNGRLYSEQLWDNVFKDPIMQEKLKNRAVFGELGHPADRTEVDMEKIAICLAEEPKKYPDGTLKGVFDILDTPNGRILKTLCDYGCQIGVSSRGEGDVVEDWSGSGERVDPETYSCECWDAVLIPAVESARPSYVTESLSPSALKLKKALTEALNKATPENKKIMTETLDRLNIDYKPDNNKNKETPSAAEDVGADVIKQLQESIKQNKQLQDQVKSLQEKLSVCNAKETKSRNELQTCKTRISELETSSQDAAAENGRLTEQLSQLQNTIKRQEMKLTLLEKQNNAQEDQHQSLNESLQSKADRVRQLNEQLRSERAGSRKEISRLQESLEDARQDSKIIKEDCDAKLKKASGLVEHYKKIALTASNKYIEAKAKMIGIAPSTIKSKLHEGYSFNDIDRICEEMQNYQLRVSSLPFDISNNQSVKVKIKESVEPIKPKSKFDDDIDEGLVNLANKYGK